MVLSKLDDLLGKGNKIDGISRHIAEIKIEVATIREGMAELEPRVDNMVDRLLSVEARVNSPPPIMTRIYSSGIQLELYTPFPDRHSVQSGGIFGWRC